MQFGENLILVDADTTLQPHVKYIAVGNDPLLEQQLIVKSQQPMIRKYTPKDANDRFGDHNMLERWRAKGREIHWLIGANNDLAGIAWYGKAPFPLDTNLDEVPDETFAVRLYEGYTGQGLAVPFLRQSHGIYVRQKRINKQHVTGLWLQSGTNNPAALATYDKLGYREVHRDDDKVTMVMSAPEVAKFA